MRAFIDTEFNGFGGELISMAIVMENGESWYQVRWVPTQGECHPWVWENVIPKLGKPPVGADTFLMSLHMFLGTYPIDVVVADWPSDLSHFYNCMLGKDHATTLPMPIAGELVFHLIPKPKVPHNALSDAHALREAWMKAP